MFGINKSEQPRNDESLAWPVSFDEEMVPRHPLPPLEPNLASRRSVSATRVPRPDASPKSGNEADAELELRLKEANREVSDLNAALYWTRGRLDRTQEQLESTQKVLKWTRGTLEWRYGQASKLIHRLLPADREVIARDVLATLEQLDYFDSPEKGESEDAEMNDVDDDNYTDILVSNAADEPSSSDSRKPSSSCESCNASQAARTQAEAGAGRLLEKLGAARRRVDSETKTCRAIAAQAEGYQRFIGTQHAELARAACALAASQELVAELEHEVDDLRKPDDRLRRSLERLQVGDGGRPGTAGEAEDGGDGGNGGGDDARVVVAAVVATAAAVAA
ncbi:hypothetical protein GGR52DRAFT_572620 [Hypoxylon sp. FL1284]|nr:hypothetical protein GGR52DRAFT_572620 [Hypoxylon sp. FL1284]